MALCFAVCRRAQSGWTPLHFAARGGKLECARLLLERGANKEAKTVVRAPMRATAAARCVRAWRVGVSLVAAFVRRRAAAASAARAGRCRAPRLLMPLVVLQRVRF